MCVRAMLRMCVQLYLKTVHVFILHKSRHNFGIFQIFGVVPLLFLLIYPLTIFLSVLSFNLSLWYIFFRLYRGDMPWYKIAKSSKKKTVGLKSVCVIERENINGSNYKTTITTVYVILCWKEPLHNWTYAKYLIWQRYLRLYLRCQIMP